MIKLTAFSYYDCRREKDERRWASDARFRWEMHIQFLFGNPAGMCLYNDGDNIKIVLKDILWKHDSWIWFSTGRSGGLLLWVGWRTVAFCTSRRIRWLAEIVGDRRVFVQGLHVVCVVVHAVHTDSVHYSLCEWFCFLIYFLVFAQTRKAMNACNPTFRLHRVTPMSEKFSPEHGELCCSWQTGGLP